MQTVKKIVLAVVLAIALFGSALGAAVTFSAHPQAPRIHVMADTTPDTTCGGGGSTFCR